MAGWRTARSATPVQSARAQLRTASRPPRPALPGIVSLPPVRKETRSRGGCAPRSRPASSPPIHASPAGGRQTGRETDACLLGRLVAARIVDGGRAGGVRVFLHILAQPPGCIHVVFGNVSFRIAGGTTGPDSTWLGEVPITSRPGRNRAQEFASRLRSAICPTNERIGLATARRSTYRNSSTFSGSRMPSVKQS